jgi:hypothetical protein
LSRSELQALAKRLREARNRARDIASQQRREMRGKAEPRGAAPSKDNVGTLGKAEVLDMALQRIGHQLRIEHEGVAGKVAAAKRKKAFGGPPRARSISSPSGVKSIKPASKVKPGAGRHVEDRAWCRLDPARIGHRNLASLRAKPGAGRSYQSFADQ